MFSPAGLSLNGSWDTGHEHDSEEAEAVVPSHYTVEREKEVEGEINEAEFRYVSEFPEDILHVTRQDILHNRLEQAECSAIELRLEGQYKQAVDKLEECLELTKRLAGHNSAAAWRAANQVAMACNTAGATLLKQSYDRSRYEEAFNLLQRAVDLTDPVDHPKRIALRAATQRIVALATKRTRRGTSKSKWGQRLGQRNKSSPSMSKSPIRMNRTTSSSSSPSRAYCHSTSPRPQEVSRKSQPSPQLGLEVGGTTCSMSHKYPDHRSPGGRLARSPQAQFSSEVRWEQYSPMLSGAESAADALAKFSEHEEEVWNQMQQYWTLQEKLEQDFLETLEGPAVNMCGLTPQQLAELQTRDLSPEDYEMLLALDEQIAKKTVDKSEIDGFESRPVTPSIEGSSCSVCMCEFEPNESVRVLPCKHLFHKECIAKWLSECNTSCPNCGVDVGAAKAAGAEQ